MQLAKIQLPLTPLLTPTRHTHHRYYLCLSAQDYFELRRAEHISLEGEYTPYLTHWAAFWAIPKVKFVLHGIASFVTLGLLALMLLLQWNPAGDDDDLSLLCDALGSDGARHADCSGWEGWVDGLPPSTLVLSMDDAMRSYSGLNVSMSATEIEGRAAPPWMW